MTERDKLSWGIIISGDIMHYNYIMQSSSVLLLNVGVIISHSATVLNWSMEIFYGITFVIVNKFASEVASSTVLEECLGEY